MKAWLSNVCWQLAAGSGAWLHRTASVAADPGPRRARRFSIPETLIGCHGRHSSPGHHRTAPRYGPLIGGALTYPL